MSLSTKNRRGASVSDTSALDELSDRQMENAGTVTLLRKEVGVLDKLSGLTAQDVADFFLASVDESSGDNISNLKLQKLVYYAQGFHLAMNDGRPLFDDSIVAWEHGPVVPDLYRRYKEHGAGAIPRPDSFDASKFDKDAVELLDEVYEVYGQFSPSKLRAMTHEETPWKRTELNCEISRDLMRDYFRTLLIDGQR